MTSHSGCQKPYAEKTHHSILYLREYVLTVGAGKTPSNRFVNEDKCFYFILSQATHPPLSNTATISVKGTEKQSGGRSRRARKLTRSAKFDQESTVPTLFLLE